jgi:hypothetical protein
MKQNPNPPPTSIYNLMPDNHTVRLAKRTGSRNVSNLSQIVRPSLSTWPRITAASAASSTGKPSEVSSCLFFRIMLAFTPAPAQKGLRIVFMVALATTVFFAAPPLLRWYARYAGLPMAGSFDLGTLNVPVLAALQFFAAVSLAFVPWRFLFPGLYRYVRDCMEDKLLENLTTVLTDKLPTYETASLTDGTAIQLAAERRRISQFQFAIRCVRLLFCLLPFFAFLALAQAFLNSALTVVPH